MSKLRIGVIVGSLRPGSFNLKLANAVMHMAPEGLDLELIRIDDLPLYNQDDDESPEPSVARLRDAVRGSDGIVFVTPEYNRSIPGVVKNAIDHASRPFGKNAWKGKPAGIMGITPGKMGTSMAQQHLRNILASVDMPVLAQPELFLHASDDFFKDDGSVTTDVQPLLQDWVGRFEAWVRRTTGSH